MTGDKALKKSIRGRMAATGESYTAARSRVLGRPSDREVAITNGDSVAGTLRQAKLAAEVIVWGDVLHHGPVPNLPPARLRKLRASHLAQLGGASSGRRSSAVSATATGPWPAPPPDRSPSGSRRTSTTSSS